MSEAVPLFDIFLHVRKGPSPIRAKSLEDAIETAAQMAHFEPFKVADGQGNVLLNEDQIKAKIA